MSDERVRPRDGHEPTSTSTCAICSSYSNRVDWPCSTALALNERDEARADLRAVGEALRDLAGCPAEFDDARIDYITVQVDRGTLGAAQAALARPGVVAALFSPGEARTP